MDDKKRFLRSFLFPGWPCFLKINFVSTEYKRSGVGNVTYNVSKALRDLGNDVSVFARTSVAPEEPWFRAVRPPAVFGNNVAYPFYAAKAIAGFDADVWHGDVLEMGFACRLAGKKPLAVSLHDVVPLISKYSGERNPVFRAAYRFWLSQVLPFAGAFILDSKSALNDAVQAGLPREKLFAVYDGVDFAKFFPEKKDYGKKKLVLAYAGGFGPRKRIDRLADAMALLNKAHGNLVLRVAGNANPGVKRIFSGRGVQNVEFLGFVPDAKLRDFYSSADVFVFPSDYEGFGLPVLEAMACGTPVVAINRSSIPEVVGSAGILCEPGAQELAEGVEKAASSEKLRRILSIKGVARAKPFTWKKTAKAYLELYEKILKK